MTKAQTAPAADEPRARSARVLIVDDDPGNRLLVRTSLTLGGYDELVEAEDGVSAQALLEQQSFDLVVTDVVMPRLDGLELMRWATAHAPGPAWIILSGLDTFDTAVEAIRLGAYEFLSKPPDVRQLQVCVANALERRKLERERELLFTELEASHRVLLAKVKELEEKSAAIQRDLQRAEVIQRVLLPSQPPTLEGLSLQTVYRPGRYVGGDLYNVIRLDDKHVAIYVADATGHGVSSAMLSVLFHRKLTLVDDQTGKPLQPAQVLTATNAALCAEQIAPGLFLTAAYCLLDTTTGAATMALAGHPPAIMRRANGSVGQFARTGPALGLAPDAVYQQGKFTLRAGDRLLLYTDGLLEGARSAREAAHWLSSALADAAADPRAVVESLMAVARAETDATADSDPDDITLLLLEARAGPSHFDNGNAASSSTARSSAAAAESLFYGASEAGSFLSVRGTGTWLAADSFHETAAGLLDEGRALYVDLGACTHLDSTFLGTLHELARRSGGAHARFQLQHVPTNVRVLFDELALQRVIAAITDAPQPLPDMHPLRMVADEADSRDRMLRAHEELAALSARNRAKFAGVLGALGQPRTGG